MFSDEFLGPLFRTPRACASGPKNGRKLTGHHASWLPAHCLWMRFFDPIPHLEGPAARFPRGSPAGHSQAPGGARPACGYTPPRGLQRTRLWPFALPAPRTARKSSVGAPPRSSCASCAKSKKKCDPTHLRGGITAARRARTKKAIKRAVPGCSQTGPAVAAFSCHVEV